MKQEAATLVDVKGLLSGRTIYVRCGEARFKITRQSFNNTMKNIHRTTEFMIEYNEREILIERVDQLLHSGRKPKAA